MISIYNRTQRDGIGFNLAFIGSDLDRKLPEPLFGYGHQHADRGYDWAKALPFG